MDAAQESGRLDVLLAAQRLFGVSHATSSRYSFKTWRDTVPTDPEFYFHILNSLPNPLTADMYEAALRGRTSKVALALYERTKTVRPVASGLSLCYEMTMK